MKPAMSFLSHAATGKDKEQPLPTALITVQHQPYCWWVALQQSPLPLEIDKTKITCFKKTFKDITTVGKTKV